MAHLAPSTWRNDLAGGAIAALVAIPVELVFGVFAVAPLGPDYALHGIRAALWGCILGGLLVFLLRGNGGMLTGTRSAPALILGILAAHLLELPAVRAAGDPAALVFVLLLMCTALAGVFQFVFGLARVGQALKYVPYPVTAGLMLGVALLLLTISFRAALGMDSHLPLAAALSTWRPASLAVTLATLAICYFAPRWTTNIPNSILALVAGTLLHHGCVALFGATLLGTTTASLDGIVPQFTVWQAGLSMGFGELLGWLPLLLSYALAIAALASLETLLCVAAIGAEKSTRPDGDRELRTQGLATMISGILGSTPSISNLARVRLNLSAGGRSSLSGLAYAATLAGLATFAGGLTGLVPNAVIAGILAYYAFGMIDDGTRRLLWQVVTQYRQMERAQYRILLANVLVILGVALVVVLGDMMKAMGIGVIAALFLFVRTSTKPVIRRVFNARSQHSLKVRAPKDIALLSREGGQIAIIEVEGPLFFGTADRIALEIENVEKTASQLILELKRVSDVDPTGARTLLQASRRVREQQKELLFAGANDQVESFLKTMGLDATVPPDNWHNDIDQALEDAEDRLLDQLNRTSKHHAVTLAETALASGLNHRQVRTLDRYLHKREFAAAGQIFASGDAGESLFVASRSAVDILIPLQSGKQKRIASFAPGIFFGEMALLEGKPRSANAVVQGPSTLWELTRESLGRLEHEHPEIACQILRNLSRNLADRLRTTTEELRSMADGN